MRHLFALVIAGIVFLSTGPGFAQAPTPDPDVNGDGIVDEHDLLILMDQWHTGELFTPTPTSTRRLLRRPRWRRSQSTFPAFRPMRHR
jgi:hypothetical protein